MLLPAKAAAEDRIGRFREIVSDPLNLLIRRHPLAGTVDDNLVMLHNGNRVPLVGPSAYYNDFSQILVINRGVHEPLEEYVFQQVLRQLPECPVMLELGAYWAHYSMWLKALHPRAVTYLVDSDETNLACGRDNFFRNGFDGEFFYTHVGPNGFTVDTFLRERGRELGGALTILHVDIQGDELDMLAGCRQSLYERRIAFLFVSTHSQALHRRVLATLTAADYRIEVTADFAEGTTSHDGFVFASGTDRPVFTGFQPFTRAQIVTTPPAILLSKLLCLAANVPE